MNAEPATRHRFMVWALPAIPVLFFVLLELGLRLAGVGGDFPLFVEVAGHANFRVPSPDVGRRYFVTTRAVPEPPNDAFLADRSDSTFRIVVQGASSAGGFPYGHGGSFPRMLEQRLSMTFPNRDVEVINTSMDAVSSFVLRDLVGEIIDIAPDAVLVYAGHNEYYGALGVASRESPGGGLVRVFLALDRFRTVQALRAMWSRVLTRSDRLSESPTMMEEMVRERGIAYDGATFRKGIERYRENLTDMMCRYRDAGIPVFVGTLVSNERDMPPLSSGLAPTTDERAWNALRRQALDLIQAQDSTGVLQLFDRLVAMDDLSATAHFERARWLDLLGRPEQAATEYSAARDRDQLPFRAPGAMNTVIREVALQCGARVVETRQAIANLSPRGIPGKNLILEHLHPNVNGYFVMADAYYRALAAAGLPTEWTRDVPAALARREVLVTPLDSALASIHVRRLLNSWPFVAMGQEKPDTFKVATRIDELAVEVLRGVRTWPAATAELGAWQESQGRFSDAIRTALALMQDQPYLAGPFMAAAHLMVRTGRLKDALGLYLAADARGSTAESRQRVGQMLVRTDRAAEAIPWLTGALEMEPGRRDALYDLGVAYLALDRFEEAGGVADRLLEIDPTSDAAVRMRDQAREGIRN